MPTTAEGIETQEQLNFVRVCGCTHAQGFLLGKPVHNDEIEQAEAMADARVADKAAPADF
jgi:diguanylate cyclase